MVNHLNGTTIDRPLRPLTFWVPVGTFGHHRANGRMVRGGSRGAAANADEIRPHRVSSGAARPRSLSLTLGKRSGSAPAEPGGAGATVGDPPRDGARCSAPGWIPDDRSEGRSLAGSLRAHVGGAALRLEGFSSVNLHVGFPGDSLRSWRPAPTSLCLARLGRDPGQTEPSSPRIGGRTEPGTTRHRVPGLEIGVELLSWP
jgi:hypothetical protein